ncbi:hypothetical protein [Psychrobacter sp. ASPA161_6]|uniref:hypothetical protein n=1 Tax=Psychrobacter sp. ASPA161_6 TaxID=3160962 RepID=UPI003F821796
MIPSITEQNIHQVLTQKMSIQSFEQWLYEDDVLESSNPALYLELISFDYSSEDNFYYRFYDNFAKYVHFYKFEAGRITEYLHSIINKDESCGNAIWVMYELYCDGYGFLGKLGIIYGLCLVDYETLESNHNIDNILDKLYPEIIDDAKNVLNWLEEGKIVFKSQDNGYGVFEYEDFRSEAEILQGHA